MSRLEQEMGFYLSAKYFAPNKAKAISEEINIICKELRPHALKVVEGLGIPEHLVNAPIAGDWLEANKHDSVSKL